MITFATKLHILLIMIVVGFGMYMFLLYKEVRIFQEDIDEMKQDILTLKGLPTPVCKKEPVQKETLLVATVEDVVDVVDVIDVVDAIDAANAAAVTDDDDDESVTSIEIKSILTNIHQVDEASDDVTLDTIPAPTTTPVVATPLSTTKYTSDSDLFALDLEELKQVKYDDLRNFLRKKGHNVKGNKSEIIEKIHELGSQ